MRQHRVVERHHPIFSPIAVAATVLLVVGLSLAVWLTGGRAFNPGDLSASRGSGSELNGFDSHAAFEDSCTQCHAPFAGIDAARCETCHTSIADQRQAGQGLHGSFDDVSECALCHAEHQGVNYDLTAAAAADYDHANTGFNLVRHQEGFAGEPLRCVACHTDVSDLSRSADPCESCHSGADSAFMKRHQEAFGAACLDCHDGLDTIARFTVADHAEVFVLDGSHAAAACETCHAGGTFAGTPSACVACHDEPDLHAGQFGKDCAACHEATGWRPASLNEALFDHELFFSLARHETDFAGSALACAGCHAGNTFSSGEFLCTACHADQDSRWMDQHSGQFGSNCLSCHDGVDRMASFDHGSVFPLTGAHSQVECATCHVGQRFAGTPSECAACHEEPAIHAGLFGENCAACHATAAWRPAQLSQHVFPLNHGDEGEIPCATCHAATFTDYTCTACHDQGEMIAKHADEGIGVAELAACVSCHPTGTKDEAERDD